MLLLPAFSPLPKFPEMKTFLAPLIMPGGVLGCTTCSPFPFWEQRSLFQRWPKDHTGWGAATDERFVCTCVCVCVPAGEIPDEHFDGSFKPEMNRSISHANPWKLGAFVRRIIGNCWLAPGEESVERREGDCGR